MQSSRAANRKYLKGLVAQLQEVPRVAAAEIGIRIFTGVLTHTAIDSGQAVLNWKMQPYKGAPAMEQAQMFWGYGNTAPVAPASYKWTGGSNAEAVIMHQYEYAMVTKASVEMQDFDGLLIYNAIQPGEGFPPGDVTRYYAHAFGEVEANLARILDSAFEEGSRATAARFHFVRYG